MRRRSALRAVALVLVGMAGCGREETQQAGAPAFPAEIAEPALETLPVAVLRVRDLGEIRIALRSDVAPKTVENFAKLATAQFYDGTTFHRVVPDFMIQGGDPSTRDRDPRNDGLGGQQERVEDERPALSQVRGIVGLANRGTPNSGGSQFYILVADQRHLDGQYAVFGRVTAGMDVADRIAAVERDLYGRHGPIDRPMRDVVLRDVRIERAPR